MERNSMGEEEIGRDRVKDEATEVQRDREGGRETVRGRETYKKGEIWKERKRRKEGGAMETRVWEQEGSLGFLCLEVVLGPAVLALSGSLLE